MLVSRGFFVRKSDYYPSMSRFRKMLARGEVVRVAVTLFAEVGIIICDCCWPEFEGCCCCCDDVMLFAALVDCVCIVII